MTHPSFKALDAHLDGELVAADAREIAAHIAQCAECARFRGRRCRAAGALRGAGGQRCAPRGAELPKPPPGSRATETVRLHGGHYAL